MRIDVAAVRKSLKAFDFNTLFREHLGWDKHQAQLEIPVNGTTIQLTAVAQKRGFSAFVCQSIPDRPTRLKIDHQVTKSAREHFVIYADQNSGQQVWQWVRREPGKPLASRDHRFDVSSTGDALIQRLEQIAVTLDEEESLTVVDVAGRARAAFDVDKVTKKFYERFKAEHAAFLKFIKGIKAEADLEWYTSLMLNRLMFVYFIQKKGFLDGDIDYLRNRMIQVRELKGKDKFQSFYRHFLVRLFHDGLGKHKDDRKLDRALEKLFGNVPYLNGGFFEVHQLEERYTDIEIPDKAFERLFDFFDEFSWHLDERPLRAGNEINPDVVGYIFEKYINQKQMGAYYTKEDITEYISKNTIIPFLFDAAQKKCPIAFRPDSFLWRLLRDDPDRYIYAAVRHGVIDDQGEVIPLPNKIAAGIKDVAKRDGWNRPADDPFALPTETWREHVARRQRCLELRDKLRSSEVHAINDLITLNLDIWQFARDAIVNSEGPELLRAFWQAIAGRLPEKSNDKFEPGITVLDPTCGSGAFLFAALQILESLYGDCLSTMRTLVAEADLTADVTPEAEARAFIAGGETNCVEFKACAYKHPKAPQPDKSLIGDIAAAVASFLNADGGDVLIGVENDGKLLGISSDLESVNPQRKDEDSYLLWIQQKLEAHFGADIVTKVGLSAVKIDNTLIARIRITPANRPVYVTLNGKKAFYVRAAKGRLDMDIEEAAGYVQKHFTTDHQPAHPPKRIGNGVKGKPKFADLRAVLAAMQSHASERYFILKSIIINNLFGVDIMEEAVEICKLRLFLKLVAQVERVEQIEPLPDIDFNIRAGNTLVGYVSLAEIKKSQAGKLGFAASKIQRIEEDALVVEKCFEQFRAQQTTHDGKVTARDKEELRKRLAKLDDELDRYLAGECGIDVKNSKTFDAWKSTHHPFHWFVEFYGIMSHGGFDIIIGNPPYAEIPKELERAVLKRTFKTALERWSRDEDLYTLVVERSFTILTTAGHFGMILPLSMAFSTKRSFQVLRGLVAALPGEWWWSHFDRIPSALFGNDVRTRCTIAIYGPSETASPQRCTTGLIRWIAECRNSLFTSLHYASFSNSLEILEGIPKVGSQIQADSLAALFKMKAKLGSDLTSSVAFSALAAAAPKFPQPCVFVGGTAYNWFPVWREIPETTDMHGKPSLPARTAAFRFKDEESANIVFALLTSALGYWWWACASDGFNLKKWLLDRFPISLASISASGRKELAQLGAELKRELKQHYVFKDNKGRIGNFFLPACAATTSRIDSAIARHVPHLSEEFFEDVRAFNQSFSRADIKDADESDGDE